jgi:hypothetical protein
MQGRRRPGICEGEDNNEGQAEREEDLQQVPDHPSAWPGYGDLLGPAAQAAPGLSQVTTRTRGRQHQQ